MKLSNVEAETMTLALQPYLERTDMIGYAAARAVKRLRDSCEEYLKKKTDLIQEFGQAVLDEEGNETGDWMISEDSESFTEIVKTLDEYGSITHEVELPTIPISEAANKLSGREILAIGFLFNDEE